MNVCANEEMNAIRSFKNIIAGGLSPLGKVIEIGWKLKRGACSLGMFLLKFNHQESECLCRMMTHY